MPNTIVFPPNHAKTVEKCPVCECPAMTVEHGYEMGDPSRHLHLEFCPDCNEETGEGDQIVIVGYNCPHCAAQQQPPYDCTVDVLEHKRKVAFWMHDIASQLQNRATCHDDSKLREPEKSIFDKWTPNLKRVEFGGDEYKAALAGMGEGLQHHYRHNRHHPEHFERGLDGMTLMDIVEMFCDWLAAAEAKASPVNLDYLADRFHLSPQLRNILRNTLRDADFWNDINGVPVIRFTPPAADPEGNDS